MTEKSKTIEVMARAVCRSRGVNPDCLHWHEAGEVNRRTGEPWPDDATLSNGKPAHLGWRIEASHQEAALTAYESHLQASGMAVVPGWEPIRTAPKDGTRLLLMAVKNPRFKRLPDVLWVKVGKWCAHYSRGHKQAWQEDAMATWENSERFELSPDYWMPVPAPPASPDGKEYGEDEQATRAEAGPSAPISTDTKGTTK